MLLVPRLCNSSHFSALYFRTLDHNVIQVSFIRFIDHYQSCVFSIRHFFYFRTMTGSKMLFACLALIAFLHPLVHVVSAQGLYFELSFSMHFKFQSDHVAFVQFRNFTCLLIVNEKRSYAWPRDIETIFMIFYFRVSQEIPLNYSRQFLRFNFWEILR